MAQMVLLVLDQEGWGDVVNDNYEKINNRIDSLLDTSKSLHATGTTNIPNLTDSVTAPSAITASATTSTAISGTGDDANINANFTALDGFTSQVVADLGNLRNTIIANQAILTNLVNKLNATLSEFREGEGIALLAPTP